MGILDPIKYKFGFFGDARKSKQMRKYAKKIRKLLADEKELEEKLQSICEEFEKSGNDEAGKRVDDIATTAATLEQMYGQHLQYFAQDIQVIELLLHRQIQRLKKIMQGVEKAKQNKDIPAEYVQNNLMPSLQEQNNKLHEELDKLYQMSAQQAHGLKGYGYRARGDKGISKEMIRDARKLRKKVKEEEQLVEKMLEELNSGTVKVDFMEKIQKYQTSLSEIVPLLVEEGKDLRELLFRFKQHSEEQSANIVNMLEKCADKESNSKKDKKAIEVHVNYFSNELPQKIQDLLNSIRAQAKSEAHEASE